jgi:2-dehydro-3-deoxygluconokinase
MDKQMDKIFDVIGLGEAMIEFNQADPAVPQYLQGYGGDTSNAIIAAARAGARCAYLTRVGGDAFGKLLLDLWQAEQVDVSAVEADPQQASGIYFVSHGERGHVFSYMRAGSAASRMTPHWLEQSRAAEILRASRYLHVSGISMGISSDACDTVFRAMELCREAGSKVSLDANLRLKLWPLARARACIVQALSMCDIFLPSLEDAVALSGLEAPEDIISWAHRLGAPMVVLKLGAGGALLSDGGKPVRLPGHSVPLVDATGAGDCFSGNLLAQLAYGADLQAAATYANAAAALAVQGYGAVAPLPKPDAVRRLLAG